MHSICIIICLAMNLGFTDNLLIDYQQYIMLECDKMLNPFFLILIKGFLYNKVLKYN